MMTNIMQMEKNNTEIRIPAGFYSSHLKKGAVLGCHMIVVN